MHRISSHALAILSLALIALALPLAPAGAQGPNRLYIPLALTPAASPFSIEVTSATYLGGSGADALSAAAIGADGAILLAGTLPGHNPGGVAPVELLGGGNGAVVRLGPDGQAVLSVTRIGAGVSDMAVGPGGTIVVCGAFGVAALAPTASGLLWSAAPGNVTRCDIGSDGTVAALVGTTVAVYGDGGALRGSWSISARGVSDIAVDGAGQRVVATGYFQRTDILKVAMLAAYGYDGQQAWSSYGFTATEVNGVNLAADSEGRRVAIGADGKLYFAGYVDGGNAIYGRDPKNIATRLDGTRLIKIDNYTDPFNIRGAKALAWLGRFEPADGSLLRGQFLLTRSSDGTGNSIDVRSIAADAQGRIVVAGQAFCCIKDRSERQVAGTTVSGYGGGEAYLLALSADMTSRLTWAIFTGPSDAGGFHSSGLSGVAVSGTQVAAAGTLNNNNQPNSSQALPRGRLLTRAPLQAQPASMTATEGYALIWRMP